MKDHFGILWAGTLGNGLYRFNGTSFTPLTEKDGLPNCIIQSLVADKNGNVWAGTNLGLCKIELNEKGDVKQIRNFSKENGFIGMECNSNAAYCDKNGHLWFGTASVLTKYNASELKMNPVAPTTHITGMKLYFEKTDWSTFSDSITAWNLLPQKLVLPYDKNHLTFEFIGISLRAPENVRYQIILEGLDDGWSPYTNKTDVTYSNIPPGKYTFKVQAKNEDGFTGEIASFSFTISPPWWKTKMFYVLCILMLIALIYFYIRFHERKLLSEKKLLEEKVALRTVQLQKQKDEIENQKLLIEGKNKDITDSILYAKRIQTALLTSDNYLKRHLPENFIIYKPRDIVSGDFYWSLEKKQGDSKYILLAGADCTGHGVPGAFMSMIGISLLNEIVTDSHITRPDDVLNMLRQNIIKTMNPEESEEVTLDGMDMAFCRFDFEKMKMDYAGANIPLYIVRNKEIIQLDANKFPIGKYVDEERLFSLKSIDLKKNDCIYIFSDGYSDQFGGTKEKKYTRGKLHQLLLSVNHFPLPEQRTIILETFENWKGNLNQVDDVLVIGVRV